MFLFNQRGVRMWLTCPKCGHEWNTDDLHIENQVNEENRCENIKLGYNCPRCQYNASKDNGCYITTACIVAKGYVRDYTIIKTMRKFRDEYMNISPSRQSMVKNYYLNAPKVVEEITKAPNSNQIFTKIYKEMVLPTYEAIINNKKDEACQIYYDYFLKLCKEYVKSPQ